MTQIPEAYLQCFPKTLFNLDIVVFFFGNVCCEVGAEKVPRKHPSNTSSGEHPGAIPRPHGLDVTANFLLAPTMLGVHEALATPLMAPMSQHPLPGPLLAGSETMLVPMFAGQSAQAPQAYSPCRLPALVLLWLDSTQLCSTRCQLRLDFKH